MKSRSVLLLLVLILLLTACTPAVQEQPTTLPTTQTTTETTAAPTETTLPPVLKNTDRYPLEGTHTLEIVSSQDVAHKQFWTEYAEAVGIDATWKTLDDAAMLATFSAPETMPDIYWQADGLMTAWSNGRLPTEHLVDFMEHLDKMPNLKALYEEDPMVFSMVMDKKGGVFFLPIVKDTLGMSGNLFYIRTDMTGKAGWEQLPETVEEFLVMCEDLKNTYADQGVYYPMACNRSNDFSYDGYYTAFFFPAFGELLQAGLTTDADWKTVVAGFATEQYRNYLQFVKTLYAEGYVDPESGTHTAYDSRTAMCDGKITMNPFATYLVPENFESGKLDFQVMPPLSSQYQQEAQWVLPQTYGRGYYMVSANCDDLDAALAFLDACYAPWEDPIREEGNLCGISLWLGATEKYLLLDEENGTYTFTWPEGWDSHPSGTPRIYGTNNAPYMVWPYYERTGTGLDVKTSGTKDILRPAGVEVLWTECLLLTEEEQSTYEELWRGIEQYVRQIHAEFVTGQADLDTQWEAYLEELDALGLQQVIDIYQAALDRYWE